MGVASGPTADSFGTSNGEWVVTLNVDFSAAGEAVVNYQLKLSNQAGDCSGSSQHSRLNAGDGVSQTGQQNVPVPANQVIELPNITVTKLVDRGTDTFVPANAGEYCFTLDSGSCTAIDANGQVVFSAVSDGAHTITESNNLAIKGAAAMLRRQGDHVITAVTEHKAVLDPCKRLEREGFKSLCGEKKTQERTRSRPRRR